MYNKQNMKMFMTFVRANVYIINQIKFKLNEFILTIIMMLMIKSMLIFSLLSTIIITKKLQSYYRINSFNFMQFDDLYHESNYFNLNFENNTSSKKRDFYTFWHRRFDHLKSIKLKKFHKITTLKKSIFIVELREFCEICSITKIINKRNRRLIERKTQILKLKFINICDSFSKSQFDYKYFLKIVNNYFRKTWILFFRDRAKKNENISKLKIEN